MAAAARAVGPTPPGAMPDSPRGGWPGPPPPLSPSAPAEPANSVGFSPGGERCVSGGQDNHILVWNLNLDVGDEGVKEKVVQEVTHDRSGETWTEKV